MNAAAVFRKGKLRSWGLPVGVLLMLPVAAACSLGRGDPVKQPAFLTPIAEAQRAGLVPYWLGAEFSARGELFRIDSEASFGVDPAGGPAILFGYGARLGAGGTLTITTLSSAEDTTRRQNAERISGAQPDAVAVGPWAGEIYRFSSATRPVAKFSLFLDIGEESVNAVADAGGSGIPGQDTNVLLDKDTLVAALTALRPYPQ